MVFAVVVVPVVSVRVMISVSEGVRTSIVSVTVPRLINGTVLVAATGVPELHPYVVTKPS